MTHGKRRTFGWVQNPGSLDTLRNVVEIFDKSTESYSALRDYRLPLILKNGLISQEKYDLFLEILSKDEIIIPYDIGKGKGVKAGESRSKAKCSGLVQAVLNAQSNLELLDLNNEKIIIKKPYCDDWTTDGYMRWAVSTGLLKYDSSSDNCIISELGKKLVNTIRGTEEEKEILSRALLSYPPVYRVLSILSDHNPYTKFEIGSRLGFKGELGFTSIPQAVYVYDYCTAATAKDRNDVRSNLEGDSDKYARMIANWLVRLGWVKAERKSVTENYYGERHTTNMVAWVITRDGEKAIEKSNGKSSKAKIPKIVKYEMLASKINDTDYVRFRRASILNMLKTAKELKSIQRNLKSVMLDESLETIQDDIDNFTNIGIRVSLKNNKYRLLDDIQGLEIPLKPNEVSKNEISVLKEHVRSNLKNVDHKYLLLIDLAYSDASSRNKKNLDAKNFEIETANLFARELEFRAERLGDSNKPDVLVEYCGHGTIIDNKSYKEGFNISAGVRDEMARYVEQNQLRIPGMPENEWWKWFDQGTTEFSYLFITSALRGKFKEQLEYIHKMRQINGGAIDVVNLLFLAERIKCGMMNKQDFFRLMKNDEIRIV